jgi:type II secretory pathway predicted ATPase ExeA
MKNPFTPSFGIEPTLFAGRQEIIREFLLGLENGTGDPNLSTVITGARGTGKTVALHEIANASLELGWVSVYTMANINLLEELLRKLKKAVIDFISQKSSSRITGVGLSGFSISRAVDQKTPPSWEEEITEIVDELTEQDIGVIFQIDEIQGKSNDLRRFASIFQELLWQNKKVALAIAGLPHQIDSIFTDDIISFLRRSRLKVLEPLSISETINTVRKMFEMSGKSIKNDALGMLCQRTGGLPYLIQLIGYEVWQASKSNDVGLTTVRKGLKQAEKYIGSSLIELVLQDISPKDQEFLYAMSREDSAAKISEIAKQLNRDVKYAGTYRSRLIREGVIFSPARGQVDFVIPYFREYLRAKEDV